MMQSAALAKVERGQLCTGCGLCAALAPNAVTMRTAAPGYSRPVQSQPLTAVQDAAISATCPGLIVNETPEAPHDDPSWGPWFQVGTGYSTNSALRHQASSGGMISGLLTYALHTGLIDFVVQTGADPVAPLANRTAISHHPDAIFAAAGSRYTASSPLADLETWLATPGKFAFVGKPCDVTALRARARQDPRIDAKVPIMLAFFCAGIPSAAGTLRILDRLGVKAADVRTFRYRGDGWPGFATATLHDGSTRRMSYADSWGDILSKEVQFRCKICPDAVGGSADVAAADAWYGDDRGYPSFEEQDGRSLMMARTRAGQALVDAAVTAGAVVVEPLDIREIDKMQPSQARRKRQIVSRLAALMVAGRPVPSYRGVQLLAAARQEHPLGHLKSFGGLLRRLLQGRA